jgi:hypothetical protein
MFTPVFFSIKFCKEFHANVIDPQEASPSGPHQSLGRIEGVTPLLPLSPPPNIPDDDILTANCLSINLEQGFVL